MCAIYIAYVHKTITGYWDLDCLRDWITKYIKPFDNNNVIL